MLKGFKILTWFIFIQYLLVLVNVIILKGGIALSIARHGTEVSLFQKLKGINFIPLKTIIPYLSGEPTVNIAIRNLLGNIFPFSPLGLMLPLLFRKCSRVSHVFLVSLCISLFIEVIQVIFYLGSGDVDDLILNVAGAILGFGVYYLLRKKYVKRIEAECKSLFGFHIDL